jgi:DNA polymerase III delta prime subunit
MTTNGYVFMEKYRPTTFDGIILDPINKEILTNVIDTGYFPNLLFYGPPGTGKTTTIINLVSSYQERYHQKNKELMIHLNASDERGIDVIRNQINQFVNSKTLFNQGMKFVILDEVDYMTKNAQQALRYLLQSHSNSVRYCLICNYISRIDEGLQHDFLKLRFNQLPENEIINFLDNISVSENLNFSNKSLKLIQKLHKSDVRSMINFMQTNQDVEDNELNIIDDEIWYNLYLNIINGVSLHCLNNEINNISLEYNIDKKNIIKDFLNYLIRNCEDIWTTTFFDFVENIVHFEDCNNEHYVNFSIIKLMNLINIK